MFKTKGNENDELLEENTESVDTNEEQERYNLMNGDDSYTEGILEILPDGYGFLRGDNYLSTPKDVYISPVQIKRFKLETGDKIKGIMRKPQDAEKFQH